MIGNRSSDQTINAENRARVAKMTTEEARKISGRAKAVAEEARSILKQVKALPGAKELELLVSKFEPLPHGIVAAFDRSGCPPGWAPFTDAAGRVIVGEGQAVGLTKRRYRDLGGEETQTLLIDQMPNHKHKVHAIEGDYEPGARLMHRWIEKPQKGHEDNPVVRTDDFRYTEPTGESKSHNNMPPYIALYFCKQD